MSEAPCHGCGWLAGSAAEVLERTGNTSNEAAMHLGVSADQYPLAVPVYMKPSEVPLGYASCKCGGAATRCSNRISSARRAVHA